MTRPLVFLTLIALPSFAQSPSFEAADVHTSAPTLRPFVSGPYVHGLRYEIRGATMLDLVRISTGVDADKIFGGPNWLEFDRFDIVAKAPAGSKPDEMKTMLQSLLAERFKLAVRSETKPFPGFKLLAKSPKFKPSDGSGDPGCRMSAQAPAMPAGGAAPGAILVLTILDSCHNVTMSAFLESIRGMIGPQVINGIQVSRVSVQDATELKGTWDLDVKFTLPRGVNAAPSPEDISLVDAVDKQLGLKLEPIQVPTPVVTVENVNRKPTANAPDILNAIPPMPTEFDVAELKPGTPITPVGRGGIRMAPYQNDRVNLQNYSLRSLINQGWNLTSDDMLAGAPKWIDSEHFDLIAKAPAAVATQGVTGGRGPIDIDAYRPMVRALLIDRFKLAVHYEDRPATAYLLTAVKPKLQKADPSARTKCAEGPGPDGKDPRKTNTAINRLVTCQNVTMAEFATLLPTVASGYFNTGISDATGLEGGWDFTVSFSGINLVNGAAGGRGGDNPQAAGGAGVAASDPTGGLSLFDALNKQLGLKLEQQKRPTQVLVIDHIEQKPTEN